MTSTTIKVSVELRDRLKAGAAAHGRTIGQHLEKLLEEDARRQRFAELRRAMANCPADEGYHAEAADWHSDRWS